MQAILDEINTTLPHSFQYWNPGDMMNVEVMNVTKYDVVEKDGNLVIQVFTDGNHDWTETRVGGVQNIGREAAWDVILYCEPLTKLYGLHNVKYEFYQNGERVKVSTELK
ncbi:MAG: hypothetical protein Q8934_16840 [Bacillota bacterium]|nr:hypothetical protein [Bacillota bacterium]